ncbi:alkaline phosphatase D family protein [Tenacibaculum ovolyticum]|uniref:alkaline phosphatase D family protein n=1 Tax=Tenacibaculum ovolyticum TaxID=104270 RepID=UPI0007EC939F|nr:alkaline phosphatase D family protein [Tenacibaculum ovolyticum]
MYKRLNYIIIAVLLLAITTINAQEEGVVTKIARSSKNGTIEDYFDTSLAPFYHGLASGDPLKDAVVIWTRITTNNAAVNVSWKMATDVSFTNIVKQGSVITNDRVDYTVKIDVRDLQPNTSYYYQFEALGKKSIIGKTRTSPTENVSNVRFGVVSCSNYQNGYFNAYKELAKRKDIDAVIHLGDYIYEYESGGYGYKKSIGRGHLPKNEIVTLNDYRIRYSYYRLDPMLRELHQQHPFILIWDDHEFANDADKFGAENHTESKEGSWETRKNNAYKAYFEWQPVRANSIQEYRLYRSFSYGNLADLLMLDTRIEGRGETLANKGVVVKEKKKHTKEEKLKSKVERMVKTQAVETPEEIKIALEEIMPYFIETSKLTKSEKEFVLDGITSLVYSYKTIGKRRTDSRFNEDKLVSLLEKSLKKGDLKIESIEKTSGRSASYKSILGKPQFDWLLNKLSSSSATWRLIGNQVMMMYYKGVPTKDAWDGFTEERAKIYKYISDNSIDNIVVLTGDIHSTYIGNTMYNDKCLAAEFIVPSVTSQNLDAAGGVAASIAEWYTKKLNKHMKDVNLTKHGYYILDVKEDRVQADWYFMKDITKPNTGQYHYKSYYVDKGVCGVKLTSNVSKKSADKNYGDYVNYIKTKENKDIKETFVVLGIYPNPMSEKGNVHYFVQKECSITVEIYNLAGIKIKTLISNKKHAKGIYNIGFNVGQLAKGTYVVKMNSGDVNYTKKIRIK